MENVAVGRKDKPISAQNANMLPIGAQLRIARQTKDISLTEMASLLNYSKSHLSGVENGSDQPSQELIQKYEQALELKPGQLSRMRNNCRKAV
jgi:transcriptional regulator with XRE-family HTH domain